MRPRLVYTMKAGGNFYVFEPEYCTIVNAHEVILLVNRRDATTVDLKCYTTTGQPAALDRRDAEFVVECLNLPAGSVKLNTDLLFHEESEAGWWICSPHTEPSTVDEERVPDTVQRPATPIANTLLEDTQLEDEEEEERQRLLEEEAEQEALANTLTSLLLIKTLGGH